MGMRAKTGANAGMGRAALAVAVGLAAAWSIGDARAEPERRDGAATVQAAQAQPTFDIPAQPLTSALTQFGQQSGLQVTVDGALARDRATRGVTGAMSPEQALQQLLAGTGLTYDRESGTTVVIRETAGNGSGPMRLRDITVTARRTEELVQDVPGSVLAIPAEEIERSNITDLEGVNERAPNVNVAATGDRAFPEISIRGISDITGARASGPTVGVYIDEVIVNPTGSNIGVNSNLVDLERVEVLYGPQGTAFGRGTIAGALNYVTKKPTETFESTIDAEVGSNPDGLVRGVLNGSLSGDRTLMARLVAFGQYDDGFIDTPNIGGTVDSQDYGARLSLRSQPTDRLTLDLSGSFDRTKYRAPNYAALDSIDGDGDLEYLINTDSDNRIDRGLVSFRGAYDFDVGTLISNTAYLRTTVDSSGDADQTELDFLSGVSEYKNESINQEFRFDSETFSIPYLGESGFLAGVNATWAKENVGAVITNLSSSPFGPPGTSFNIGPTKEEVFDVGVFGEFRFRPIRKLELATGGRVTYVDVEASQPGFDSASTSSVAFTPKGSALYEWTEDFSTYVLISTGFKSGGFNGLGTGPLSGRKFDNETAINYEGGFKSSWFDDRLFVNASAFALFYKDIQVISLAPPPSTDRIVQNAARARSVGTELEITALPTEGLQLNLGYGFADAKFTDFTDSPSGDATGQALPNAPRHTLSLVADYAYPVFKELGDAFIRAEYSYTSSFNNAADFGVASFDAYDVLNLRGGLRAERFDIELFVENLLDEKYITGATGGGNLALSFGVSPPFEVGATRRFGARARIRF